MIHLLHALDSILIAYSVWLYLNDPEKARKVNAPAAVFINGNNTFIFATQGNHIQASVSAAFTALAAWFWYNGGGGGGHRIKLKNLKRAARRFVKPNPEGAAA